MEGFQTETVESASDCPKLCRNRSWCQFWSQYTRNGNATICRLYQLSRPFTFDDFLEGKPREPYSLCKTGLPYCGMIYLSFKIGNISLRS